MPSKDFVRAKKLRGLLQAGAVLTIALSAGAAFGQSPGSAAQPNTTIPEKQHTGPVDPPTATTNGVIKPKGDADPGMTKTPPPQDPAETPVIPPKATPGGDEAK